MRQRLKNYTYRAEKKDEHSLRAWLAEQGVDSEVLAWLGKAYDQNR